MLIPRSVGRRPWSWLGMKWDQDVRPALLKIVETLRDESAQVRQAAFGALAPLGPIAEEAVPALSAMVSDDDPLVVMWTHATLQAMDSSARGALPALAEALRNPNVEARELAATTLGAIGGPEAVAALAELVRTGEPWDRRAAINALGTIGAEAEPAVPALTAALDDEGLSVRRDAAKALGAIGPGARAAVPALITSLDDRNDLFPESDIESISRQIRHAIADEDPALRQGTARALLQRGTGGS